jgi:hypothetical protein
VLDANFGQNGRKVSRCYLARMKATANNKCARPHEAVALSLRALSSVG